VASDQPIIRRRRDDNPHWSRGAHPTVVANDLLNHLQASRVDTSSLAEVNVGGSACPPALMHAFADRGIQIIHGWGMPKCRRWARCRPPAGVAGDTAWAYRYIQGRVPA
jgi:fatty-acyl-CoA synthase